MWREPFNLLRKFAGGFHPKCSPLEEKSNSMLCIFQFRKYKSVGFYGLFFLLLSGCGKAILRESSESEKFHILSEEILEDLFRFYPVTATEKGIHRYGHLLATYTPFSIQEEARRLKDFQERLREINPEGLGIDDRIDYELLTSNVEMNLFTLDRLKEWERNPLLYIEESIRGVFALLSKDLLSPSNDSLPLEREGIIYLEKRLFQIPRLLKEGKVNLKNPPKIFVEVALERLESGREFLKESISRVIHLYPAEEPVLKTAAFLAGEAMVDYRNFLDSLQENVNGEFSIGKENYEYKWEREHLLSLHSDDLLEQCERILRETKAKIEEIKSLKSFETSPLSPSKNFLKGDVLQYYQWEVDSVRKFCEEKGLFTFPQETGRFMVMETPSFLQDLFPRTTYLPPPPFHEERSGVLLVKPVPDIFTEEDRKKYFDLVQERKMREIMIRFIFPGHHLQTTLSNLNPSGVRKFQDSALIREGWASYCEGLLAEEGLYEKKEAMLEYLNRITFQSAKGILDVRLHKGGMKFEEGVNFLVELFGDEDREIFEEDVREICLSPTESMCSLIGRLEILDLREKVRGKMGNDFSLPKFHEMLLSPQGNLTDSPP